MYLDNKLENIYMNTHTYVKCIYDLLLFRDNLYCYAPSNRDFPTLDIVAKVEIVSRYRSYKVIALRIVQYSIKRTFESI